jgi:nicotinamidase-related amidase
VAASAFNKDIVMSLQTLAAKPEAIALDLTKTALVVIDMQRDFLEPGGFGASLGNDVSLLRTCIEPCQKLLSAARSLGMMVIHTREGHLPDLSDAPIAKIERGKPSLRIGSEGPMGRILVRGEPGHDIIPELAPWKGELVIDKPGKGAFYQTDLQTQLQAKAIENLLVCGVTTEVCVHTTVREANVISDACGSYFPEFHDMGLRVITAQGGIFGWVATSSAVIASINNAVKAA